MTAYLCRAGRECLRHERSPRSVLQSTAPKHCRGGHQARRVTAPPLPPHTLLFYPGPASLSPLECARGLGFMIKVFSSLTLVAQASPLVGVRSFLSVPITEYRFLQRISVTNRPMSVS
jgi:hypothetical protein